LYHQSWWGGIGISPIFKYRQAKNSKKKKKKKVNLVTNLYVIMKLESYYKKSSTIFCNARFVIQQSYARSMNNEKETKITIKREISVHDYPIACIYLSWAI
jgi:hypothetical protein